jgi:prepilin-type N-terminal cleavage/methylation domain-containing protein
MRPATRTDGFTLLEIVVVLGLLGLTLLFTVPRFSYMLNMDPALRASRWILNTVQKLKRSAVADQRTYVLQIDVPANRLWVTTEADAAVAFPPPAAPGIELSGEASLLDVVYPGKEPPVQQTARIRFFPQGYSDRAVIHLALDGRRRFSFQVEPFLASARLLETYTGFEE